MSRSFDGTDDVISCGSGTSIDNIFSGGGAIVAWIRPTGWGEGNFGRIAQKDDGPSNGWGFLVDNSAAFGGNTECINFYHWWSTGPVVAVWETPTSSIALNAWQHVAIVYNKGSTSNDPVLYINGVSQTITETTAPAGTAVDDAASDLYIGDRADSLRCFVGQLAHIHAYKGVTLSAGEIRQLMRYPGSIRRGLAAYWPLWGTSSPEPDYSGNGNSGTVTGATAGTTEPPINGLFYPRRPRGYDFVEVAAAGGLSIPTAMHDYRRYRA